MPRSWASQDRVEFLGFVPDLNAFYGSCHVFALPSTDARREGFGLVLLEAMACGRPVIATPIVGIARDIEPRGVGVLVPPDNPHALAAALKKLRDLPADGAESAPTRGGALHLGAGGGRLRADVRGGRTDGPPQWTDDPPRRVRRSPRRAESSPRRADGPPQGAKGRPGWTDRPPQRAESSPRKGGRSARWGGRPAPKGGRLRDRADGPPFGANRPGIGADHSLTGSSSK